MTQRPIRVVHLVGQLDMGGMEKLLVEFARHANRRRFALHFVSFAGRGVLADEIEQCGWPVTTLNELPGLRPGLILRLAKLFRRFSADVVHTHNTKPLLYGGPGARLAGIRRVIHTRHGQRYHALPRQTHAFRLATRLASRIVCVSEDSSRLALTEGVNPRRLCTIRNGIDVTRFQAKGPNPVGPTVMVSRLSPEKDVETLLRATALVVRQEPDFRLEIAGDGVALPGLRRASQELSLNNHVTFLGTVRDVATLLGRASMFVLPSLTEGISLTILEAMSTGLPVIATSVGGNVEVVQHNSTGLLVPPREPELLAAAILRVVRGPTEARRLGQSGRERVEQCFDIRHTVAKYEELYLSQKRTRTAKSDRRACASEIHKQDTRTPAVRLPV